MTIYHDYICLVAKSHPTLCDPMDPARFLYPWDFPSKNTGVGCCSLLQGIFLTQETNPSLLCLQCWQADSSSLVLSGKPDCVCVNPVTLALCAKSLPMGRLAPLIFFNLSLQRLGLTDQLTSLAFRKRASLILSTAPR